MKSLKRNPALFERYLLPISAIDFAMFRTEATIELISWTPPMKTFPIRTHR